MQRVIRLKDASKYLGMDKNRFNKEVRPTLSEFSIGKQGIGFDRVDLDAWFDQYKQRNGRSPKEKLWEANEHQDLSGEEKPGTLTKLSQVNQFESLVKQAISKKRKNI